MKPGRLLIGLTSLLLGLLFDVLFFDQSVGLNGLLFTVAALVATGGLTIVHRRRIPTTLLYLAPSTVFFALMTVLRANSFLQFIDICLVLYLLVLIAQQLRTPTPLKDFSAQQYMEGMFTLPILVWSSFVSFTSQVIGNLRFGSKKRDVSPIVRGVLLSLPILIIFGALFASADLVFKNYVTDVFHFHIPPTLFGHVFIITLLSSLFIGLYTLLFTRSVIKEMPPRNSSLPAIGTTESLIILGSVTVLFLLFMLIQVTYLFGGMSNVVNSGITYAQYARKGFFELIAVATLSLILIAVINGRTLRRHLQQKIVFMWLSGLLILEVLGIIASALKRLALYEQAYGFTTLRLYSHLFVGWLAVAFILLYIHILREEKSSKFAFRIFVTGLLLVAIVNILNPDALIAKQNIQRYKQTGKIDALYLTSLSDDATPVVTDELYSHDGKMVSFAKFTLDGLRQRHGNKRLGWRSYNTAQAKAQSIFEDSQKLLRHDPGNGWPNPGH